MSLKGIDSSTAKILFNTILFMSLLYLMNLRLTCFDEMQDVPVIRFTFGALPRMLGGFRVRPCLGRAAASSGTELTIIAPLSSCVSGIYSISKEDLMTTTTKIPYIFPSFERRAGYYMKI